MKKNFRIILLVAILSLGFVAFKSYENNKISQNSEKDKVLLDLMAYVLERGHFSKVDIDDAFSEKIFDDFLEAMDPFKRFFLEDDYQKFEQSKYLLDDQFLNKELTFFEEAYGVYLTRLKESESYYKDFLSKPIDFSKNDTFNADYENLPHAKTKKDLLARWQSQLKYSVLGNIIDKEKEEDKKFEDDNSYIKKTFKDIEKESRESVLKTMTEYFNFVKEMDRDEWFSVYLNAISSQYDPHTNYMAPDDKDRFDTSMSGKFEGIGAKLQKKNEFTEITELISGGPAWRSKELEVGDVIIKVAQGSGEPVDVVGMRLDRIVKLIKGKKGTKVKLTVKKVDGDIAVISIIRDEVETEETFAKSSIINRNGVRYGIINLPKFYIDFNGTSERDAASDVAIEIDRLKQEGIEGLIFDVRNNGGGSLKTVVDIMGMFVEGGPVVQVVNAGGKKNVLENYNSKIKWDGPLVVLVNSFSASASEILAAAVQDYKRGVVLGSTQTYGKGTVQNIVDFNSLIRNNDLGSLGALKITSQKFYRINGGSTQLEGVQSDVVLPDRFAFVEIGEKDMKNAMPWSKVSKAKYQLWDRFSNYDDVISMSKQRVASNEHFQLITEQAKWVKERRDKNIYQLQIDAYKKELKAAEDKNSQFKKISDYKNDLEFLPIASDLAQFEKDDVLKDKRQSWFEDMTKDIYLEEAIYVLDDMTKNSIKKIASKP